VLALAVGLGFGLHDYFSLEALKAYRQNLHALMAEHPLLAPVVYVLVYVATVAVSFPGAGFLTIVGGFLFGAMFGTALALVGATAGATLVFIIARSSLGDLLARRAGSRMQRLRDEFQREGFSYLLFIRLVPIFPFWLVNLAAALVGMRVAPFVAATLLGILPFTVVLAWFGSGLELSLKTEKPPTVQLVIALALFAAMALLPLAMRKWRPGKGDAL
jgi:uncharacterized membrane protein YdjX (TVP38/TMEM64 family)